MTRDSIRSAALIRFSRSGYADTSLKEIAGDVGIKAPSIYAHFASKQELYTEVYAHSIAEHRRYFTDLLARSRELEPLERLHKILTGVPAFYRERPELIDFHLRAVVSDEAPQAAAIAEPFRSWDSDLSDAVRATYLEGRDRGDFPDLSPEAFTAHFLCLMDGLFLQLKHYAPELYDEHLTRTWDLLAAVLRSAPASR